MFGIGFEGVQLTLMKNPPPSATEGILPADKGGGDHLKAGMRKVVQTEVGNLDCGFLLLDEHNPCLLIPALTDHGFPLILQIRGLEHLVKELAGLVQTQIHQWIGEEGGE